MKLWVGTSGYSYKPWVGNFYPEGLPAKEMLRYYATQLPSVEINNTFYRLPKESVVQSWADQVGPDFRFVLKAPQRITHVNVPVIPSKKVAEIKKSLGMQAIDDLCRYWT